MLSIGSIRSPIHCVTCCARTNDVGCISRRRLHLFDPFPDSRSGYSTTAACPHPATIPHFTFLLFFPDFPIFPQSDQTWQLNDPGQRTCERQLYRAVSLWLTINLGLYLDSTALHFSFGACPLTSTNIQKLHSKAPQIGTIRLGCL